MFFRELDFNIEEIKSIMARADFDAIELLQSHLVMLEKKSERINELVATVKKTIRTLKEGVGMQIKEYYQGFSEEQIEKYRQEVRRRWGEKTLQQSEERIIKMGKDKFSDLQKEGGKIFQTICDHMSEGSESKMIQTEVAKWRQWLENFHHYSDEAILGLGRGYSQDPEFAEFFKKYHKDLPEFLTEAIEHYCSYQNTGVTIERDKKVK
jgi:MerR family transcriptional regulator, thiopeptide resistance regulator